MNISFYVMIAGSLFSVLSTKSRPFYRISMSDSLLGPSVELHHSDLALYKRTRVVYWPTSLSLAHKAVAVKELAVVSELYLQMHDGRQ